MIQPAPPALRNGPCAAGMELEAARARYATPTLFEDHDERHDADSPDAA